MSTIPLSEVTGYPQVAVVKPEFSASTKVSHDLTDRTTWYQQSTQVTGETLTDSGDGLTFDGANANWIDLENGKLYDESVINDGTYDVKIYIDDVLQSSGYTVNHSAGSVTFDSSQSGNTIKADYHYENGSTWTLAPTSGKLLQIEHAEIQFSKNISVDAHIYFEVWAYNPYDLPNKVMVRQTTYKSVKDLIAAGNLGQGYIPAIDVLTQDVVVFPFNYVSLITLKSSQGAELRVRVKDDTEFGGEWGVGTFYVISRDE